MIELLNTGLDFNHWWVLQHIGSLPDHIKIRGWVLLLQQKGYIDESNALTDLGKEILEVVGTPQQDVPLLKADYLQDFYVGLHKKMQDMLVEKTGKKQKVLYGSHSFLCNAKDLESKLKGVMNKYRINDLAKVESVMLAYVERCVKHNFDKVQLVQYYIMKDNMSRFAADYDAYEEPAKKKDDKHLTKKDLF